MKPLFALLCGLLLLFPVTAAWAQDVRPPDYRFESRSTVAGWDLVDDQGFGPLRPFANVPLLLGDAVEPLHTAFPAHAPFPSAFLSGDIKHTQDAGGGYLGGSTGDGAVVFVLPHWLEAFENQRARIQVAFQGPEPHIMMTGYAGIPGNPTLIKALPIGRVPVQDERLPPQRAFFFEDWFMKPSPTWSRVTVFVPADTILFHVVIDTIAFPIGSLFEDDFEEGD